MKKFLGVPNSIWGKYKIQKCKKNAALAREQPLGNGAVLHLPKIHPRIDIQILSEASSPLVL